MDRAQVLRLAPRLVGPLKGGAGARMGGACGWMIEDASLVRQQVRSSD